MTKKRASRAQRMGTSKRFTLGTNAAENDPLLSSAFFENADYATIADRRERTSFIVGRTGAGKSAILRHLMANHPTKVISLSPEQLALSYLSDVNVIRFLHNNNVHLEPFFKALWKHVSVVEIFRHRYKIDSPAAKTNILEELKRRLMRDSGKKRALQYLEEFGDKFWCEMDERVRQVTERLNERIEAAGGIQAGIGTSVVIPASVSSSTGATSVSETERVETAEQVQRFQRIVNETQLPLLNQMVDMLDSVVLDSDQHFMYLVIDDLDQNWVEDTIRLQLVRCLLEAVVDLSRVESLKIVVALRTNLFNQLDYASQQHGPQEEKIQSLTLPLRWNAFDLEEFLERRVTAASDYYNVTPPISLGQLLPNAHSSRQSALEFILDRTLMRPRDVIAYMNFAIRDGAGRRQLSWDNIRGVEKEYSKDRIVALRDEWKDPYLHIDMALERFRRCTPLMNAE